MQQQASKKTAYFLIELIINCLFFVIAAAVCINLFVTGYIDSKKSGELSVAMTEASNTAEVLKATDGDLSSTIEILGFGEVQNGMLYVYYDENWQVVTDESLYEYILSVKLNEADELMLDSLISVQNMQSQEIYNLNVKHFLMA